MKWIKLYEEFQMGDLNIMSPREIITLFFGECGKQIPNLELIKVILDNGLMDIHGKEMGNSLLLWGVFFDNIAIVELLIEMGADVNALDDYGQTVLHYVYHLHRPKEMRELLKRHVAIL